MTGDDACRPDETILARLQQRIVIGGDLTVELITSNMSSEDISLIEALHAYCKVSDIANISVSGLDGCEYADKRAGGGLTTISEVTLDLATGSTACT